MATHFSSFSEVIVALGERALAEGLDLKPHQPRDWRIRNSIPPEWWGRTVEFAAANGVPDVTLECLAKLAEKKIAPATAAA